MKRQRDDGDDGGDEERVPEIAEEVDLSEDVDEAVEGRAMGNEIGAEDLIRFLQRHRHHPEQRRDRHEGEHRAGEVERELHRLQHLAPDALFGRLLMHS